MENLLKAVQYLQKAQILKISVFLPIEQTSKNYTLFCYKQHVYKQHQAEIDKKSSKF